jgi:hypothetical protein
MNDKQKDLIRRFLPLPAMILFLLWISYIAGAKLYEPGAHWFWCHLLRLCK